MTENSSSSNPSPEPSPSSATASQASAPQVDPAVSAWVTSAEARLTAFFSSAEERIASAIAGVSPQIDSAISSITSTVESDLEGARQSLAPLIARGKDLVAQMESLAATDVSSFTTRLKNIEGALFSLGAPIVGEAGHDAHNLIQRFVADVKHLFAPKPTAAATPSPESTSSASTEPSAGAGK